MTIGIAAEAAPLSNEAPLPAPVQEEGAERSRGQDGATVAGTPKRRVPVPLLALALALLIDLSGVLELAIGSRTTAACVLVLLIHAGMAVPLVLARGLTRSQRWLLVALELTLPVAGALLAVVAFATRGRAGLLMVEPEEANRQAAPLDPTVIRRLADALPIPEVLMVGSPDDRRAMLSTLGRRADAESVAILRWALTATPPDVGTEAALALEDMSTTFEKKLVAFRDELGQTPGPSAALAAAYHITRGIESGMPDATRVAPLADEARRYFGMARALDASAASDAALGSARLEIAALNPRAAVDVLDGALKVEAASARREQLCALREEALLCAHELPARAESALPASPRAALPLPPPPAIGRSRLVRLRALADRAGHVADAEAPAPGPERSGAGKGQVA